MKNYQLSFVFPDKKYQIEFTFGLNFSRDFLIGLGLLKEDRDIVMCSTSIKFAKI